jgi:hypothetical protein
MSTVLDALARPRAIGWTRFPFIGALLVRGVNHRQRARVTAKVSRLAALREAGVVTDAQFQHHWTRLFPETS